MKRSFLYILFSAALLSTACAVDDDFYVDASDFGGYTTSTKGPLANYSVQIVDLLLTPALLELEEALSLDENSTEVRYFYDRGNGTHISQDGSCWTLLREGKVRGLKMRKEAGRAAWILEYDGNISFGDNSYPTTLKMTATKSDASDQSGHYDWSLNFEGTRTEHRNYSCDFFNDGEFLFKATTATRWEVFGYEILTVYKRNKQHDKVVIRFNGGKSDVDFARIP